MTVVDALPCQDDCKWPFSSILNGRLHTLQVPAKDDAPAWSPTSDEDPPISLGQASRASIAEFNRYMSDEDDWVLISISLLPCQDEHWIYVATWKHKNAWNAGQVMVPVLMSGKAVSLDGLKYQEVARTP